MSKSSIVTGPEIYKKFSKERRQELKNFQERPDSEKSEAVKAMHQQKAMQEEIKEWEVVPDETEQTSQETTHVQDYLNKKTDQDPSICRVC